MTIDRRNFLKAGVALAAAAGARSGCAATDVQGRVDALLGAAAQSKAVPGVVAIAMTRDGIIYEGAFGSRNLAQSNAMTPDTVAWIASMTKAVTATAAMQLVEQGRLSLDVPVTRWVPDLSRAQVLEGWDENGQPRLRAPRRAITLRHLLTHTAGFGYDLWDGNLVRYQQLRDIPGVGSCKNIALTTPLLFDPGERWEYGINIDWAGKAVEAVSGVPLGVYLKDNVFDPLGMTSTAFKITPDMRTRLAKIHAHAADGSYAPIDFELPQEPEFEMGGGGLYSTAGDYARFVRMFLNGGRGNGSQVLKPQTVALMSRNAMGDIRVTMLKTEMPGLTNDAEFFPGMPKSWGLSFMINEEPAPTGRPAGSLAWAGLANTYFWIDQKSGVAGVYLTQVLPFADRDALPLFYAFEKTVYQSLG
jgi:CubicO group peptidase (beta-lactamase class C family)